MAKKICCNFPETMSNLPKEKACLTGTPIRAELKEGSRERGLAFTGLSGTKPILMVTGGSLGAVAVNEAIRKDLAALLETFDIVHLCGKGKLDKSLEGTEGYLQYEYISAELPDLFAAADIIVSRAGANAICEIAPLRKRNLLIPLSAKASRGDQILNAQSFEKQGFSFVLPAEQMNRESLCAAIDTVWAKREAYRQAMENSSQSNGVETILRLIIEAAG